MALEQDTQTAIGKGLVVWVSTITGMAVADWAALFAIVYTLLQTYVLIRDKLWRRRKP